MVPTMVSFRFAKWISPPSIEFQVPLGSVIRVRDMKHGPTHFVTDTQVSALRETQSEAAASEAWQPIVSPPFAAGGFEGLQPGFPRFRIERIAWRVGTVGRGPNGRAFLFCFLSWHPFCVWF